MRVYIAARLSQRPELHSIRKRLWDLGHEVVSTWIGEGGDYQRDPRDAKKIAIRDMCQISMADLIILDTTSPISYNGGAGREFEYGFAIGQYQYKDIYRVGPANNAFHFLVDESFETWDELLEFMGEGEGPNASYLPTRVATEPYNPPNRDGVTKRGIRGLRRLVRGGRTSG